MNQDRFENGNPARRFPGASKKENTMNLKNLFESGEKEEFYAALNRMANSEDINESTYGRAVRDVLPAIERTSTESVRKVMDGNPESAEELANGMRAVIHGLVSGIQDATMNCIVNLMKNEGNEEGIPSVLEWITKMTIFMVVRRGVQPTFYTYSIRNKNGSDTGMYPSEGLFLSAEEAEFVMRKRILKEMGSQISIKRSCSPNEDGSMKEIAVSVFDWDGELMVECLVYPVRITS